MKATIRDGKLTLDMEELLASLSDDERRRFSQYAVFSESVMEAVVDTVAHGGCFDDYWYIGGLAQKLREKLLPLMPAAVIELVEGIAAERDRAVIQKDQYQTALYEALYHWPSDVRKPEALEHPWRSGNFTPLNKTQIDAWIGSKLPPGEWDAIKANFAAQPAETAVANG